MRHSLLACSLLAAAPLYAQEADRARILDPDSDGDGLSDFHEQHKYHTDPALADSDGDGRPDGDWDERREWSYTLRSILQVAPPVTEHALMDDYQDARILDRTDEYVELEVIHYPFSNPHSNLEGDPDWRNKLDGMEGWLQSGPTSNFDAAMGEAILKGLRDQGGTPESWTDAELARAASRWLLSHAKPQDGFSTFCSSLQDGEVRVQPGLERAAAEGIESSGLKLAEQWDRELFAKGMFKNERRGTCTSSAIYLNAGLRAVGLPSRIILTVPLIDASDPREFAMLDRIHHPRVREVLRQAIPSTSKSWTSHTYNEVFVAGRWRRLNDTRLGQPILDPHYLGLMTHVATVSDWLDGGFAATWGLRQAHRDPQDAFGFANPYSTLTISERLGEHADALAVGYTPALPGNAAQLAAQDPQESWTITDYAWSDERGRRSQPLFEGLSLLLEVHPPAGSEQPDLKAITKACDPKFDFRSGKHPRIGMACGVGGISGGGRFWLVLPLGPADLRDLEEGAPYQVLPRNAGDGPPWIVKEGLTVVRGERQSTVEQTPTPEETGAQSFHATEDTFPLLGAVWSLAADSPLAGARDIQDRLLVRTLPGDVFDDLKDFTTRCDGTFFLVTPDHPPIEAYCGTGGWTVNGQAYLSLHPKGGSWQARVKGATYTLVPRNAHAANRWVTPQAILVRWLGTQAP